MQIGEKIKRLRIKNGLTQAELAARAELTKGFISQVERDQTSISIATLRDVLECLGTDLRDFFNEAEDEQIVFRKEDVFVQEDKETGCRIDWIVPNSQKNDMEPMLVELAAGGRTPEEKPHPGEEFGYVLSGTLSLYIGQKRYRCKKGESFYYKASAPHHISNDGKSTAKFLWVAAPPSF